MFCSLTRTLAYPQPELPMQSSWIGAGIQDDAINAMTAATTTRTTEQRLAFGSLAGTFDVPCGSSGFSAYGLLGRFDAVIWDPGRRGDAAGRRPSAVSAPRLSRGPGSCGSA